MFIIIFLILGNEIDYVEEDKKAKRQRVQAFSKRYRTLLKKVLTEADLEPQQTSKMELFAKIVNDLKPLTICAKSSILDF